MEEEEEMTDVCGPRVPIEEPPDVGANAKIAGGDLEAEERRGQEQHEEEGAARASDGAVEVEAPLQETDDAQLRGSPAGMFPSPSCADEEEAAAAAASPHLPSSVGDDAVAVAPSTAVEDEAVADALSPVVKDDMSAVTLSSAVNDDVAPITFSCRVEDDGPAGSEDEDVATSAEDDAVNATEDDVVATAADDDVVAATTEEDVAASMEEDVSAMAEDDVAANDPSSMVSEYAADDEEALGMDGEKDPPVPVEGGSSRGGGRKRRGRPPKGQAVRLPTKKKEEEDLCFICFDGGNLVVCDRRGCPKVYHPACVNRDEAFFRSKGRWNCGWHICSICEKAALYLCLTCTYSLCKGCIKESEFVCVRGNKGFCATCRSTVMLIETNEQANGKTVGVDFDDKNSWEYLFKDYWLDLKGKLSITLEELTRAKNPWKGSLLHNEESSDELYDAKDDLGSGSDSSSGHHQGSKSARKKLKRRSRTTSNEEESRKVAESEGTSMPEDCEWASKELLEFVEHMRAGDKSVMSPFDVQPLLLEYIKQNNLRDPRRKSQIICDSRLENLFGKPRVGHFEMLKLLELHFPVKETSQAVTDDNQGGVIDPESSQMDTDGKYDVAMRMSSDKKRRSRKRMEEREPQTNLDDYAAIDVHNINLIYLRRHLMEDLIDDTEKFNEKVVGSFVKIRISGTGQRQDMYRLVQVVGTCKAAEKYKTGKRTTDITLEILNLNKTEVISIDSLSNQEFTEEECKRLRQSIKCGLINRLTVGEVQEKARALQAARVNDWLESEKSRLGNLRDRASEKGRRKELRECVEKLQLLNTPEERSRRLNEVAEIHVDPHMDPSYESAEEEESDDKKQENYSTRDSVFTRKGREVNSSGMGSNKNTVTKGVWDKLDASASTGDRASDLAFIHGRDVQHMNNWDPPKPPATATVMDTGGRGNSQLAIRPGQLSDIAPEASLVSQSSGVATPSNISEADKLWHYQDPSGKIQGPFSMTQLRKWNTTGYFPPNLRIWRTFEKQEHSILLTDALIGKFQQPIVSAVIDGRENNQEGSWRGNNSSTWMDKKKDDGNWKLSCSDNSLSGSSSVEQTKADGWAARSSGRSVPSTEPVVLRGGQLGSSSHVWESAKDINAFQPQVHNAPPSAVPFSGNTYQPPAQQGRGGGGGNVGGWNGVPAHGNMWNSTTLAASQLSDCGYERQHSANWGSSGQQSGGFQKVQPPNVSANRWGNDSFDLPMPTLKPTSGGWIHTTGNNSSASSSVQPTGGGRGSTPSQRGNTINQSPTAVNEPGRTASGWTEQPHVSVSSAVGGWKSNSAHPAVNPTEMVGSWDSFPAAAISVAKASEIAAGFDSSHSSSVRNVPSEPDPPITSANQSTLATSIKNELATTNNDRVLGGYVSMEIQRDFNKKQGPEDDCPSPTPKDGHIKFGALTSECSRQVSSQFSDSVEHPLILHNIKVDPEKKCYETHGHSADESSLAPVNCLGSSAASVAPTMTQTSNFLARDGLETLKYDMNKPVAIVNQSPDLASSTSNSEASLSIPHLSGRENWSSAITKLVAGSDRLESVSAQRQVVDSSSSRPEFECQEKASSSSQKHDKNSLDSNSVLAVEQWEQSQFQKPGPIQVPEPATSGNWVAPTDMKSTEWSMPSPTPTTKPSGLNVVVGSASSTSQSDQQVFLINSKPPPSSAHWGTNTELALPLNVGQSSGDKDIKNTGQGVAPENSFTAMVPAKGNANMGWGTSVQGNSNTGWGTMMQGNMNVACGTPGQGNTNVNIGVQGNANAGMGRIAPVQGNTGANVGWGTTPVQGHTNLNVGWGITAPGNTQANPSWGMVAGQGISNPNPGWVTPTQENANPDPRRGPPAQGNTNPSPAWGTPSQVNVNAGWAGQGNSNSSGDAPAGNPGSWGTQQKQNAADRYPSNGERGFPGSESGHGGGRHGWNRMQPGGGGSSRPPPRGGQRAGVCKFHENGHCKKGANCSYYHT